MTIKECFLQKTGWAEAAREPLMADASLRHYDRLRRQDQSAILMDMPPPLDIRTFFNVAKHLETLGCSVPEVLAADEENGLALLEDFGNNTFSRLLNNGMDAEKLYRLAIDTLIHLHSHPQAVAPFLPVYDEEKILTEAGLLADWFMPAVFGIPNARARQEYLELWHSLCPALQRVPQSIVLRDFHVDNLMVLNRPGLAACGLLDFQDSLIGAVTYDLVSLLEDARRDVAPALRTAMKERYLSAFPTIDRNDFETTWAIFATQRHAKVIGLFVRLCVRDGKPGYLHHLPRVWRLLEDACMHPALKDMKTWLDRHIPQSCRVIPHGLNAA